VRLWRVKRRNLLLKNFSTAPPKRLNTKPTSPTSDYFGQQWAFTNADPLINNMGFSD
jgi:hypothetical protein